ncbi:MAG: aryl-sulfate sulfotransferase [Sphingobacteriaceae bacterium]|jgi:hypothetical protein
MKLNLIKKWLSVCLLTSSSLIAQQWNGYTYYSNTGSTAGYLIDTNSVNVNTWTFTGGTGYSTHMIPGGTIFRSVQNTGNVITGGGVTGRIQKVSYTGTVLWDYTISSATEVLHHDHCPLPNGNVLVIVYDVRSSTELAATACTNSTLTSMQAEKILELKPVGTNSAIIVWQWNVWDHLVQNVDPAKANYQTSIVNHPELLNINYLPKKDWIHMNGIDYNPILDQIVVSSHNLNEWYIIDHSTTTAEAAGHTGGIAGKGGDFLYRWGNPAAYQASGTTILNVTHDAHWIPEGVPGAGNIVGLNNKGVTSPSNKTTVDHITPPRSNYNYTINPGNAFTPATYLSRHTSAGYTSNMGCSNQFPNGNQMICLATAGSIYEIDAAGNTLWTKSTMGITPQAHRYTPCYVNNAAPPQPTISLSGNDLVCTSATTYQWYFNGDLLPGANSQTYTPSQNGIYVVRTTDANGCVYVYSSSFIFGTPTKINKYSNIASVEVFPNPSNGTYNIKLLGNYDYKISVKDINGKELLTSFNAEQIDMNSYNAGVYFMTISNDKLGSVTKKITLIK